MAAFMAKFDSVNFERIKRGLQESQKILEALPKKERGIKGLQEISRESLYALFEALHSEAILQDEQFLTQYFDRSFLLIQENRRLKLNRFPPAVGYFLFQSHPERNWWAQSICTRSRRNITATEFQWSIQEPLSQAMGRVQLSDLDKSFMPTFWSGVKCIGMTLDADLITHSLRAMHTDVCRLALEHLQVDNSAAFKDLALSMQRILELSAKDFWDSMGPTPATVWIQQFTHSKAFARCLGAVNEGLESERYLEELLGWTMPFVLSNRPVLQPAVCRDLTDVLLNKLQTHEFSDKIQEHCKALGFRVLTATLNALTTSTLSVDLRSAIAEVLDLVQEQSPKIISMAGTTISLEEPCASLLHQALTLEVQCLENDSDYLSKDRTPPGGGCVVHRDLWKNCCKTLTMYDMPTAKSLVLGCKGLVGIEKFVVSRETAMSSSLRNFNEAFDSLNSYTADMFDRLNDYDPAKLQTLFEEEDVLNALGMQLLSSDGSVRSATVEIIKTTSGQEQRYEAFADALTSYFEGVLNSFSLALRRIGWKCAFEPASTMLNFCRDVLDILSNASKGILRVSTMSPQGIQAVENFWGAIWEELFTIFSNTEAWSNMGHPRSRLMSFCTDVMEFAGHVFHQFPVFVGALSAGGGSLGESRPAGRRLTEQPKATLPVMVKFLRLRDDHLLEKSTALVCDVLSRLKQYGTVIDAETATSVEDVITDKTRTVLTIGQKAELQRALEENLGKSVAVDLQQSKTGPVSKKMRTGVIDLENWQKTTGAKIGTLTNQAVLDDASKASTAYRQKQAGLAQRSKQPLLAGVSRNEQKPGAAEFAKKRQEEIAAKKKRDAEAAARARSKMGGSGLSGIGVAAKDHGAPKGEGVMVSSDESEDDGSMDEMDKMLFGDGAKQKPSANDKVQKKAEKKLQPPQGPVKKQRLVRSARDMRARLAPDLGPLHKQILSWDPNHDGPFPPGASQQDYASVLSAFRDPSDYQNTFQPLLLLEAWNGFLKAKEDSQSRPIEMKVVTRSSVDAFSEVSASMDQKDFKDIVEGDIVLIAKDASALGDTRQPKCLSRVMKLVRKKTHIEYLFRVIPGGPMASVLNPGNTPHFLKIMPIVPLEREYGALLGLQYYDLCEEIAHAKPSPLLPYKDETLAPFEKIYTVNKAQAKAIKSALDNDAFTLVQGPPGSGKTKTIVAIVGALLTNSMKRGGVQIGQPISNGTHPQARAPSKKMLVCAPSNAAVDELVMRFKEGVKLTDGSSRPLSMVRIGRSDAINANVHDVTLDELIDKRLNLVSEGQAREETTKLMRQHQDVSAKLREARAKNDDNDTADTRQDVEDLRKAKKMLDQKIDMAKDNEGQASRQAELNRRKVQQEIIEEAHVICATLSGSGHDMFQNLNVEFETVVIDEAAQCVELSALIPLKYGCAKCILVGDPQQLPPTVFSREAANFKYEQSLFVRMQANHPNAVHLLDTQYRMHPDISSFPSSAFYDSRLKDGPDMAKLRARPWHEAELTGPFRFFDVQGQHQSAPSGHSLINKAEVRVAIELYRRLLADFKVDFVRKVGVITPYKSQLRELKARFSQEFGGHITRDVEFNTTDAFQGRESEIIIFSCVRASPAGGIGFLQDIRRMNVGLTRAKSSLWVLGNSQSLMKGEYWRKLVQHAQRSGHFTQGNIEALLKRPLKKTKKVDAPSTGDKMPMLDYGGDSDEQGKSASRRDSGAMDIDEQSGRQPSKMPKPGSRRNGQAPSPGDKMDIDGEERHTRPPIPNQKVEGKQKSSPSNSSSEISVPSKRKLSKTANGPEKKAKSANVDVEMKESTSKVEIQSNPTETERANGAGSASSAARPQGIAKRPPPKAKKGPTSVFMTPNRRQ